jgi:hypothetical protein
MTYVGLPQTWASRSRRRRGDRRRSGHAAHLSFLRRGSDGDRRSLQSDTRETERGRVNPRAGWIRYVLNFQPRETATFGLQLSRPPLEVPVDSLSAERDLAFLSESMVRNSSLGSVGGTTRRRIIMAECRCFPAGAPPQKAPGSIQSP